MPGDLDRVLALQLRISRNLFATASQTEDKDPHFFLDLVAVAHLVKFSWPLGASLVRSTYLSSLIDSHATAIVRQLDQPLGPGPRSPDPWSAPNAPAQTAALLSAAAELLSHRDEGDADFRDWVQPLARTAFKRLTPNLAAGFRRMDFSPALARALARRTNSFYNAGGHRSPRLRAPSRACLFSIKNVPALLPAAWSGAHFAELRKHLGPITNWNTRHLRRAASLKLVEMAAGGTWPECAEALGTPWNTAQQSLKSLKRLLGTMELWAEFDRAVEQVACALDSDPQRIDYANRRHALSSWRLSDASWNVLCEGFKTFRGGPTSPSPTAATALLWARVTQGDYLHSPVLNVQRNSGRDTTLVVASMNQLLHGAYHRRGEKFRLVERLDRYAERLAIACDRAHRGQGVADSLLTESPQFTLLGT